MPLCIRKSQIACCMAGLGDFVLMVGEDQVVSTTVDVNLFAEMMIIHSRYSMCQPGRPLPQGLSQAGSPEFGGLPQGKIHGVSLR